VAANAYGLRLLRQPRVRFTVLALLAIIVLAFRAVQFLGLTREIQWGYDFSAYWAAADRLLNGAGLYTAAQLAGPYAPQAQYLYLYPPPLATAVTPLAALFPTDYRAGAWIWTGIGAAILLWAVLMLWRSERLADRFPVLEGRGRWLLVAAAFAFPPVVGELVLGNVHLLLLGLLTIAWLGIRQGTPRGELAAGIAVGLASVIKVFPGVLIVWFLLTRRYRAAAGVAIGAAAFALLTLPITGIEPWTQFPTVLANLSAPSDTTDTLAPTVWLAAVVGFTPARIVITLAGLAILAVAARASTADQRAEDGSLAFGDRHAPTSRSFALAVTIAVLVAPALYHHYLALLVLPMLLGLGAGVPLRWLVLSYLLMWGGTQGALGDLAWIVNRAMPTLGALVLLASLAMPLRSPIRQPLAPA
jgi:alpha-1,2-mannosyltransferase